jgi:hypothetical protein
MQLNFFTQVSNGPYKGINLGYSIFRILGPGLEPFMLGLAVMLIFWISLYWMYRKRLFLRI